MGFCMRILAVSDIHGDFAKAEKICEQETAYDLILLCGDLTTHGTPQEVENALVQFQSHGVPIFAVAGNMDSPDIDASLVAGNHSINGTGKMLNDVGFFGVSAAPLSPLHTPYEISEEEILQRATSGWNQIKDARWKVFVPHSPPRKTKLDRTLLGRHVGSISVRSCIEQHKPDVVVCGHIHESRGVDTLGRVHMVNCGPAAKGYYAVIEVGTNIRVESRG
jgi:putative phosphoesterase